jgi:flagellar biosynthesis/type III secretory pathway protein FliH
MSSMKAAAMAEIEAEQARAERYQEGYADGYREGFGDGYDRALADIKKLKQVATEEMLGGRAIAQVRESKTIPGAVEY